MKLAILIQLIKAKYFSYKTGIRLTLWVLFCFPFSNGLFAQVLDSAHLQQQKLFVSLDEALLNPSAVYRLSLKKQHLKNIPDAVFSLSNLQELDLSHNHIQNISPEIKNLKNLQRLDFSANDLKSLPAETGALMNLKWLCLKRNRINSLPEEISNLKMMTKLDLWGNPIIQLPMQMAALRKSLKIIDMRGINMKTVQRNAITDLLPETKIYFSGCNCN